MTDQRLTDQQRVTTAVTLWASYHQVRNTPYLMDRFKKSGDWTVSAKEVAAVTKLPLPVIRAAMANLGDET